MTDWQRPTQPPPIAMPVQAVAVEPRHSRWRGLKIAVVTLLVVALLTSGLLNLGFFLALLGGESSVSAGELEEIVVSGKGQDKVAIISISGVLSEGSSMLGDESGYGFMLKQVKQALNDSDVKAVVLEVDSPGGGVTASDILAHKIKELVDCKTVVVSMKSLAASGGYYVSAYADEIYANPTTITGSIGVIYASLNMKDLMDKIGVSPKVVKSGPLKDFGSIYRAMTPEEQKMIQGIIDDAFVRFKDVVFEGRDGRMTREEVDAAATGGVFTAKQALELKLIDKIGYLEDAVEGAKKHAELTRAKVVRYAERPSFLQVLLRGQAQQSGSVNVHLSPPGMEWPGTGLYYMWEPALLDKR